MDLNRELLKKVLKIIFITVASLCILFTLFILFQYSSLNSENYTGMEALSSTGSDSSFSEEYDYESSEPADERESSVESEYIKTGEIYLLVDDIDTAKESLENIKDEYNGEYTYSYESGEGLDRYVYLTLKIESSNFEEAFEEISDIEGEIDYSSTDVTDVTQEYTDLQSRLENAEAVETQLLEILEDADTVEDTLSVYTELASVRETIEVLKGQIKYLDTQTDYSYITVKFSLSSTGGEISEEEWKPLGVIKDALRALVSFGKTIVNMLIWVLVFSPIGLVIWGIYWIITKKIRKTVK